MDHDVVKYFFRGEDEPPVVVEVPFAGTASPAGLLFADGDAPIGYVHNPGIVGCLLGKDVPGDFDITIPFTGGKRRLLGERILFCFTYIF